MIREIRIPFFIAAAICLLLAVLMEVAASDALMWLGAGDFNKETPGFAINYLALLDGIILYNVVWMILSILAPRSITGRAFGIVTLVLSFFAFLGTLLLVMGALGLLMLMISLLVAVPFGTIAYFAAWGHFARDVAAATLLLSMILKIAFLVLAVLAHRRFLENKGLMILIGLSIGLTWVTGFVHAFLPGFLVSIGDALMALVVSIIAAIWLLLLLINAIIATIKAIISLKQAV